MKFLVENSIYVALIVAGTIMVGVLLYLTRIDARLRKLERGEKQ